MSDLKYDLYEIFDRFKKEVIEEVGSRDTRLQELRNELHNTKLLASRYKEMAEKLEQELSSIRSGGEDAVARGTISALRDRVNLLSVDNARHYADNLKLRRFLKSFEKTVLENQSFYIDTDIPSGPAEGSFIPPPLPKKNGGEHEP